MDKNNSTPQERQVFNQEAVERRKLVSNLTKLAIAFFALGFIARIVHDNWYQAEWLNGIALILGGLFLFTIIGAALYRAYPSQVDFKNQKQRFSAVLIGIFVVLLLVITISLVLIFGMAKLFG